MAIGWGIQEQVRALETAIALVELDCAQKALTFVSEPPLTYQNWTDDAFGVLRDPQHVVTTGGRNVSAALFPSPPYDIERSAPPPTVYDSRSDAFAVAHANRRSRSTLWWNVQLGVAVVLGMAIFAAIDGRSALDLLGLRQRSASTTNTAVINSDPNGRVSPDGREKAKKVLLPSAPSIPVPNEYGAYALSNGQLTELDLLPMRVPDQRVAISPVISTPSRTHLTMDKLEFVVFRRDLANSAPDRVAVRVVAQVKRALTFDRNGKAVVNPVEDAWVVRSNSYQMRVAPVADNPEMILIRPDPPELALPAGRYALVLKGAAYDFTVDGPLADTAHCLERTDALNFPVYTECRNL